MGKRFQQLLYQRRYIDGKEVHEKMLKMVLFRDMKIKTTMKCHYTSIISMAYILKVNSAKY